MVGLRQWWKMAVLSAGILSTAGVLAAEGPVPSTKIATGRVTTIQQSSRGSRGNPFASISEVRESGQRNTQRRPTSSELSPADEAVDRAWEDRLAQSGEEERAAQTASGEKTAFFGCGWGFGCYPCRPACRPACAPVGYGCPSPCPAPIGYGPSYGGGCAPVGGCYPPPAPAGGFYSGPVIPPVISSPVIGTPAGYYGGGYYPGYGGAGYGAPGYGAAGYGAPGYGAPGYGYPVYGDARSSPDAKAPNPLDREMNGKTRAVSRLQQDDFRNPFAD